MEEVRYCPICGEKLESDGYNYDDGHIHYHCLWCDWEGVDCQAQVS